MLPAAQSAIMRAFDGSGSASFGQLVGRSGLKREEAVSAVLRLEAAGWVVCSERQIGDGTLVFVLRREDEGGEG